MSKKNILLVGGGGHCRSCIDVIEQSNQFEIVGIVDSFLSVGAKICGYSVLGSDEDLPKLHAFAKYALITVGQLKYNEIRRNLYSTLRALNYILPTIISPFAYVARDVEIGSGTIVMHHAIINTNAKIGENCIVNTKSLIEHDAVIFDHCHISTGAIVNGHTKVNNDSFVGSNAVVVHNVSVPEKTFIKANHLFKG